MNPALAPLDERTLKLIEAGFEAFARADHKAAGHAASELLALERRQVDGLYLAGLVAAAREDFVGAEDFFERAILVKRDFPDPWIALLQLLQRQDRKDDFEAVYALAATEVGDRSGTRAQLANLLVATDPERALSELDALLLKHGMEDLSAAAARLRALVALGRADEAAAAARTLLARRPDGVEETALLGITLVESGQFDEARQVLAAGVAAHPEAYVFRFDLCLALHRAGKDEAFSREVAALLERFPDDPQATFLIAYRDLAQGRFTDGFARYESRKRLPGAHVIRSAPIPEWHGEPMPGERLLVFDEQGYGDNLMFARFLPHLLARGMAVTIVCPDALYALFAAQPGLRGVRVIRRTSSPQWAEGDRWCALMSLPHLLGVPTPTQDIGFPYLQASPDLAQHWQARLRGPATPKVGLAWAANPRQSVGRERSLPRAQLAPILAVPGVRFFSLQVGPGRLDGPRPGIEDLAPELFDFADTLAAVAALDLVITVDTSVAHVAGALGKPCWVMTPFLTDWRFSAHAGGMSWWYPATTVFRQPRRGEWESVVARVARALSAVATCDRIGSP
jgi:tetratricopeptide (TPR) repeat protein